MATPAYCYTTATINMDEKPEEITIRCKGRITAESAHMFQRELRDHTIPQPRANGFAVIKRIVLDLSNVTHIDSAGLKALLDFWAAGKDKCCSVEVINFRPQASRRAPLLRLNHAFTRMLALFA